MLKPLVTLLIEHFNSIMRSIYEMPTVQQFCYQFSAAVEETLKRISNCGFSYFTSRDSYYDVPEGVFRSLVLWQEKEALRGCDKDQALGNNLW